MRLISLSASEPSFHNVSFNKAGLSLIVGKQKPGRDTRQAETHTYNGVGKSLLLFLINYCLGADRCPDLEAKLSKWRFFLVVELQGRQVRLTRDTSEPDLIWFGEEKLKLDDFRDRMRKEVFPLSGDIRFLTLRSLISLFLRPGKTAYNDFAAIHYSEMPIQRLMRSSFLLGLDVNVVLRKYDLRQESKEIAEASAGFAKDAILKAYFTGEKDVNLEIRDLQEQLDSLDEGIADFKIAENYHDVERRVADLKAEAQRERNSAVILEAKIRQVDESLRTTPELSLVDVQALYESARIYFSEQLKVSLEEVSRFHRELLSVRQTRLKAEKQTLQKQLAANEDRLAKVHGEIDSNLRFLNEHGALGEFISLSDRANEVRNRLQKLKDYNDLKKKYKHRRRALQAELATADVEAAKYLDENEAEIEAAAERFRQITRAIYPEKQSGLTIENDEGENQTRFKIEAKIISDASEGIGEAKIFAYDTTLVSLKRNHDVAFVCHDSRLFADIDPRQRAKIFQIARDLSEEHQFQYIATLNEDQIEAVRNLMSPEEFEATFSKTTVLELTDESAADKLLGIDVDIDYN
jgi:uncharacterized protein YydD (DUF2326 family)